MEVVVYFERLGAGRKDHGLKESGRCELDFAGVEAARGEGEVGEETVEDAELWDGG